MSGLGSPYRRHWLATHWDDLARISDPPAFGSHEVSPKYRDFEIQISPILNELMEN